MAAPTASLGRAAINLLRIPAFALKLGASYGVRIRLPHAVVMQAVFGKSSDPSVILTRACSLAFEHAKNLAYFAFIYKAVLELARTASVMGSHTGGMSPTPGSPAHPWHAALAGAIGAHLVWSRYSSVNYQIVMYLLSRVLIALVRALAKRGVYPFAAVTFKQVYPVLAVLTWATVMYIYETDASVLHPSLAASMHDIYRAANVVALPAAAPVAWQAWMPSTATLFVVAHVMYTVGPAAWRRLFALPEGGDVEGASRA